MIREKFAKLRNSNNICQLVEDNLPKLVHRSQRKHRKNEKFVSRKDPKFYIQKGTVMNSKNIFLNSVQDYPS